MIEVTIPTESLTIGIQKTWQPTFLDTVINHFSVKDQSLYYPLKEDIAFQASANLASSVTFDEKSL